MYFRHSSRVRLRLAMAHARLSQDCTSTSQSRTVLLSLAEARRLPSGLKATLDTTVRHGP